MCLLAEKVAVRSEVILKNNLFTKVTFPLLCHWSVEQPIGGAVVRHCFGYCLCRQKCQKREQCFLLRLRNLHSSFVALLTKSTN